MARLVRFRILDGIAIVTLDAPPVNALSIEMRAGLWEAISRVNANADIKAAVVLGAGRLFSAGANINDLNETAKPPSLVQLCDKIEACTKPVVAAIHGQTLGSGAEIMMAAHYRVASPNVQIGLPETSLGLIPNGGGTQRLPRLIGAETALHLLISTGTMDALSAQRLGLIDEVIDGDLAAGALEFAQGLVAKGQGPRPTRANRKHLVDGRAVQTVIAKARRALSQNPLHAPQRIIDCVEVAGILPFDAAVAFEQDAYDRCASHPQSQAFRHAFIAEHKIDSALIEKVEGSFKPVEPMGKAAVKRLRMALQTAADYLVQHGISEAEVDGAMVNYGFRRGAFGGKDAGSQDDAVVRRLIAAMLVEGAACVEQGAVQRPSDIDVLTMHGFGFPRRHGGPFRAAQTMGLIALRKDMRLWSEENEIWDVPDLLDDAIKEANGFDALGQS